MADMSHNSWQNFFGIWLMNMLQFTPILYCKYRSTLNCGSQFNAILWWLFGFVFIPSMFVYIGAELSVTSNHRHNSVEPFLWLGGVEAIILSKNGLLSPLARRIKFIPTLDSILFLFVVGFSIFWALLFNSIENPVQNQPLRIIIDLKRNATSISSFLAYFVQFFIIYFCIYVSHWCNHRLLVDHVFSRHGLFHYFWTALIFTWIAVPVLCQIVLFLPMNTPDFTFTPSENHDPFERLNYEVGILIMALSFPLILAFKWLEQSKKLAVLETQKVQNELLWLQQQVNPHFLFNTLNNLYSMILTKSEKAPALTLQLANLLRFTVYQGGESRVLISNEIEYLNNYLALQQLRVSHKCQFDVRLPTQVPNLKIAPLMLINLVENAFKHGVEPSDGDSELAIEMKIENNTMTFTCVNSIDQGCHPKSVGIGLKNLKRRLALHYPDTHTLTLNAKPTRYIAALTLELTL